MRTHLLIAFMCVMALLFSTHAQAEGGCPPGQYPQRGQGWQSCIPIPGQNAGQGRAAPPRWEDRWQAVATDTNKGILGTSIDKANMIDAENSAMRDCVSKGGTECAVAISYGNGCVAMVVGTKLLTTGSGPTKLAAENNATGTCAKTDKSCTVYYSACSLPSQVKQ
jgi:hypothetical protein